MSELTEQLREAADEIERLQNSGLKYERLVKNGLVCGMCGGCGSVGNPPDDYYDCPECVASHNKIKAEAVIEAAYKNRKSMVEGGDKWLCSVDDLVEHANKLERGEL